MERDTSTFCLCLSAPTISLRSSSQTICSHSWLLGEYILFSKQRRSFKWSNAFFTGMKQHPWPLFGAATYLPITRIYRQLYALRSATHSQRLKLLKYPILWKVSPTLMVSCMRSYASTRRYQCNHVSQASISFYSETWSRKVQGSWCLPGSWIALQSSGGKAPTNSAPVDGLTQMENRAILGAVKLVAWHLGVGQEPVLGRALPRLSWGVWFQRWWAAMNGRWTCLMRMWYLLGWSRSGQPMGCVWSWRKLSYKFQVYSISQLAYITSARSLNSSEV